jgi:glucose-6-phosphate 1-epimerase
MNTASSLAADSFPSSVRLTHGPAGLPVLRIEAAAASGSIALNGAHVMTWTPAGHDPVLWMSRASRFTPGAPIRGGIPICFPWFNRHTDFPEAPQHGFARICEWSVVEASDEAGEVTISLRLTDTPETRTSVWPYRFEALYTVTLGASLTLQLEVTNRDSAEFAFEEALHTYFAVGDARQTTVHGFENVEFSEADRPEHSREARPVTVGKGVSRRYRSAAVGIIHDAANGRRLSVAPRGASAAILWNPGPEGAAGMDDFDDDWAGMVCLETCNLAPTSVTLPPGGRHRLRTVVTLADDPPSGS